MLPSVLWPGLHFALKHMAVKKGSVKECFIETALWLANVKSNRFGRRYIWNLQTRLTLHKVENPRTLKLSVLCVAKRTVCPCLSAGAIRGVMHECLSCTWVCPTHCRMNSGTVLHSLCFSLGLGSICTVGGLAPAVECTAQVIAPAGRGSILKRV